MSVSEQVGQSVTDQRTHSPHTHTHTVTHSYIHTHTHTHSLTHSISDKVILKCRTDCIAVQYVQYSINFYLVAANVDHAIVIVANIIPRGPFKLTRMERPARPITGRRQYPEK